MSSPHKAPAKLKAVRIYLPHSYTERRAIEIKLKAAAKKQKRSVSSYVLLAALAQAERDLAGAK